MRPVAVLFALPIEARRFLRMIEELRPIGTGSGSFSGRIGDQEVRVYISGYGYERSASAAREALDYQPAALVITGFAGALDDRLQTGDIVVADDSTDATVDPPDVYACDAGLRERACAVEGGTCGGIVTVSEPICSQSDKAGLAQRHGHVAVDMESAAAASIARASGIPFVVMRVIVDRQRDAVPPALAEMLGPNGELPYAELAAAMLRDPRLVWHASRLARQAHVASIKLASFLGQYIAGLDDFIHRGGTTA